MFILTIPQNHCAIIEAFGKYKRTMEAGLRVKMPWENVKPLNEWQGRTTKRLKSGHIVELNEQVSDTRKREYYTKDSIRVTADAIIRWKVIDPVLAVYEVDGSLPENVDELAQSSLRGMIGKASLDELNSHRTELSDMVSAELSTQGRNWGVLFIAVEVKTFEIDDEVAKHRLEQNEAEMKRRAMLLGAEGDAKKNILLSLTDAKSKIIRAESDQKEALIRARTEKERLLIEAQGEREANLIKAEGEKEAKKLIAEAERIMIQEISLGQKEAILNKGFADNTTSKQLVEELIKPLAPDEIAKVLIANKTVEGMEKISENPADKVFFHDTSKMNMILNDLSSENARS